MPASARWTGAFLALGLTAIIVQALAFAGRFIAVWLDSDFLYPHVFAADVLSGQLPFSGWTLSSAPYLFPDFALYSLLLAATGSGALGFGIYAAIYGVTLSWLVAWTLRTAGVEREKSAAAAVIGVNLLLACGAWDEHARYLALLVLPGFHGGAILIGLTQLGLWMGPVSERPSRSRRAIAASLLFVGAFSDTLVLTQFVGPFGLALVLCAGRGWWRAPRIRALLGVVTPVVIAVVALRLALPAMGWVNFTKVVRYTPAPDAVWGAGAQMLSDLVRIIAPHAPAYIAIAIGGVVVAVGSAWRRRGSEDQLRIARWTAIAGLLSTTVMPVLSVYWTNANHARLILPWLIMPWWWAMVELGRAETPRAKVPRLWARGAILLILGGAMAFGAWRSRGLQFAWPYPRAIAVLDEFLAARGQKHGLADFWHAHHFNVLGRTGVTLNQLRPDGRLYFWNNNAFQHFTVAPDGRLTSKQYTFILLRRLVPEEVRARFGEPAEVARVGDEEIWLYSGAGARRLTALVDGEVRPRVAPLAGSERIVDGPAR